MRVDHFPGVTARAAFVTNEIRRKSRQIGGYRESGTGARAFSRLF
jgi:hypothetical protein